ncbi:MAG: hypothetical protein ACQEVA_06590 [Myxococcota bacterium]
MTIRTKIADATAEIGKAVRRPEELAERWKAAGDDSPTAWVFPVLLAAAALGTAAYGITMKMHMGVDGMLEGAFFTPLAAGLAWIVSFPALFIIKRILGSDLDFSTTALAATITVSFGATAMLASVPINWFFTLALPYTPARLLVNAAVFGGVGICMVDVFLRVMRRIEPEKTQLFACLWLGLVVVIGMELYAIFNVSSF